MPRQADVRAPLDGHTEHCVPGLPEVPACRVQAPCRPGPTQAAATPSMDASGVSGSSGREFAKGGVDENMRSWGYGWAHAVECLHYSDVYPPGQRGSGTAHLVQFFKWRLDARRSRLDTVTKIRLQLQGLPACQGHCASCGTAGTVWLQAHRLYCFRCCVLWEHRDPPLPSAQAAGGPQ